MAKKHNKALDTLYRKGLILEYITVGYNFIEACLSLLFGMIAQSIALIGFGLDSVVESLSGLVLLWRLKQHGKISKEKEETIERKAMKFVAITFFILGAYVLFESIKKLAFRQIPQPSLPGILIAIVSMVVMPLLTVKKYTIGKKIKSNALIADSKETLACSFLSMALLLGLGLNYFIGLWYADPLVGIMIVVFLLREGWQGWHEVNDEKDE